MDLLIRLGYRMRDPARSGPVILDLVVVSPSAGGFGSNGACSLVVVVYVVGDGAADVGIPNWASVEPSPGMPVMVAALCIRLAGLKIVRWLVFLLPCRTLVFLCCISFVNAASKQLVWLSRSALDEMVL